MAGYGRGYGYSGNASQPFSFGTGSQRGGRGGLHRPPAQNSSGNLTLNGNTHFNGSTSNTIIGDSQRPLIVGFCQGQNGFSGNIYGINPAITVDFNVGTGNFTHNAGFGGRCFGGPRAPRGRGFQNRGRGRHQERGRGHGTSSSGVEATQDDHSGIVAQAG